MNKLLIALTLGFIVLPSAQAQESDIDACIRYRNLTQYLGEQRDLGVSQRLMLTASQSDELSQDVRTFTRNLLPLIYEHYKLTPSEMGSLVLKNCLKNTVKK